MLRIRNSSFLKVWIPAFAGMTVIFLALPAFALNSITVMADNSMSIAMVEQARDYSREQQIVVNTSFAAPVAQETQITEGGAADILITPKQSWIDQLKMQGLIDVHSQTEVAKNQLALVGPPDSPLSAKLSKNFPTAALIRQMEGEPAFVVGNPETQMSGIYGKEALRNLDVADDLEPYTLYIKQADQMFDMVSKQHAYGIFLNSSVVGRDDVTVLDLFPKNSYRPITYYAVVIGGDNMNEARKFLQYLKSADAKKIFSRNGFSAD